MTTGGETMDLHGRALLDYLNGDQHATIVLHRDDGFKYPALPARQWFYEDGFENVDQVALSLCQGRVLDIGGGSGAHALALQDRGLEVVSLEVSPAAAQVMTQRGVRSVVRGNLLESVAGSFDTVLLIGSIGVVETLAGLDRFLAHLGAVLVPGGRLITDSVDPHNEEDADFVAYRRRKVAAGHYEGERTLRFEYKGQLGPWFEWMHVAFEVLVDHAARAGFTCSRVAQDGRRFLCLLELSSS